MGQTATVITTTIRRLNAAAVAPSRGTWGDAYHALPKLIERYTDITGKPRLLPLFGYGLSYVANMTQDASQILDDGLKFRDREIPCDIIGLEPQWTKQYYDSSHNKTWNQDRFFIPSWLSPEAKRETFIGGLERMFGLLQGMIEAVEKSVMQHPDFYLARVTKFLDEQVHE